MNGSVDLSGVQYAVIQGLPTEAGPERFVIAYPNEQTLRDVIAAPSIVALGFASREEAVANSRTWATPERHQKGLSWAERQEETGSALRKLGKFLVTSYRDIVTSAAVLFSSRSGLSAAIRIALGSSV